LLLVREVDRRLRLTERAAAVLHDPRDPDLITTFPARYAAPARVRDRARL
jgi:hypothetical protein